MEQKKYELTSESITLPDGTRLYRIKALRDFGNVNAGDLGGFIEKENNLSHSGNARVGDNAEVSDNARVCDDTWVGGNAQVCGNARVSGNAGIETDNDLCLFGYFGSLNRTTTAFKTRDGGIGIRCGCFYGTLDEFRQEVKKTHGDNDYAREYLMIADLIEHKLAGRKGN